MSCLLLLFFSVLFCYIPSYSLFLCVRQQSYVPTVQRSGVTIFLLRLAYKAFCFPSARDSPPLLFTGLSDLTTRPSTRPAPNMCGSPPRYAMRPSTPPHTSYAWAGERASDRRPPSGIAGVLDEGCSPLRTPTGHCMMLGTGDPRHSVILWVVPAEEGWRRRALFRCK